MLDVAAGEPMTLARLLAPATVAAFFERYFERETLHIARGDASYFSGLYALADVEAAIQVGARDAGRFAMTKGGATVDPAELQVERTHVRANYTGKPPLNVLDPRAIAARFEGGHTLLISDAALFSPRLQALCNQIQRETLIYVQANVYLTPPNEQGFALHHDTHDTLVLQIEGTKQWRVRPPLVELPIESQPSSPGRAQGDVQVYDLAAGDTLYLPRGHRHECVAGNVRSLHVTLAMLPVRAIELAEAALRVAATVDVELRRALAYGWQDAEGFAERFGPFLAERLRTALSGPVMRAARDLVVNELFATTRALAAGALGDAAALPGLGPSSRVTLRPDAPFVMRASGEDIVLIAAGKATTLPGSCVGAIRALQKSPMTVAELEAMVPSAGLALARLLVLDGLATI
jgi:lysine-specific demethylase/histidyl-hydroxylase NO66